MGALLVRFRGPRRDALAANLAHDPEDDGVVVLGVGVIARRAGVLGRLGVGMLLEIQGLAQVDLGQPELQVRVVGEEVLAHSASRWSICLAGSPIERSRRVLMISGSTSPTSPTMR